MNNLNSSEDPILFAALKPLAPGAHIVEFQEFFRFRFGDNKPRSDWEGIFPARIQPIGQGAPDEIWYTRGPVEKGINADICFVNCPHFMTSHMETFIHEDTSISEATYMAYSQLIRLAQESGYPYLARAWNFLPDINRGDNEEERYKQFSVGRANAFGDFRYVEHEFPAGTAVGVEAGGPLSVTLLTSRDPCQAVENPRQRSAYKYPPIYGKRSPSFSRGVVVGGNGNRKLLLSGTASIVGHESRHNDDLRQQVTETVRNIKSVVSKGAGINHAGKLASPSLGPLFRVYLRRSADIEPIKEELVANLGHESQIVFLRGDICRSELDFEIEGVIPI